MTQRSWIGVLVVLAVIAAGLVWSGVLRPATTPDGMVALEWQGAFDGEATLPAQLAWCPITRLGTLEAIRTDTGVLFSLRERDSLTVGSYPIVAVAGDSSDENLPRPAAVAAMRWVLDSATILGFRGVSGSVDLASLGPNAASGEFDVLMVRAGAPDSIRVQGHFRGVPRVVTAIGCP